MVVADSVEFDAYPAAYTYVGRLEECLWRGSCEVLLGSRCGWNPDGYVAVVVVVVVEHGEDLLIDEEGWFAVRELFGGGGEGCADSPDSAKVLVMRIGFLRWVWHGEL